jgi:hypothetical protein
MLTWFGPRTLQHRCIVFTQDELMYALAGNAEAETYTFNFLQEVPCASTRHSTVAHQQLRAATSLHKA